MFGVLARNFPVPTYTNGNRHARPTNLVAPLRLPRSAQAQSTCSQEKWSNSRQRFGKVEDRRMNSSTLCLFIGSNMGEASSTRLDIHWHSWFSLCSTVYLGLLRITQCTQGPWEDYDIWILSSTPTVVFLNCFRQLQWNQLRNWWSPIGRRPVFQL